MAPWSWATNARRITERSLTSRSGRIPEPKSDPVDNQIATVIFGFRAVNLVAFLCFYNSDESTVRLVARALLACLNVFGVTLFVLFFHVDVRYFVKVFAVFLTVSFIALFGVFSIYADGKVG
ncbi:hypothetical protein shim_00350 [Shimia sp. SK013]|uniref:hypothetical protein n=1 Tax=Shimia sp. SK013 TaxID=1389006 RepID=UPI0006CC1D38|nr:hypothetical protein [Shimia sp. SK013]KPA23708.1 hypothetical protein shim_00350 [Shimia sp. SK013]